jgi:hypothetical protein
LPPELPWPPAGALRCALLIPPPRLDSSNDCCEGGADCWRGGALRVDSRGIPVEPSLALCETPGFARAMLEFERAAPGLVRASAFGCNAAWLRFASAGAPFRSCACDIPPPLRYVGCVREASLEAPGCAACDCPGSRA